LSNLPNARRSLPARRARPRHAFGLREQRFKIPAFEFLQDDRLDLLKSAAYRGGRSPINDARSALAGFRIERRQFDDVAFGEMN